MWDVFTGRPARRVGLGLLGLAGLAAIAWWFLGGEDGGDRSPTPSDGRTVAKPGTAAEGGRAARFVRMDRDQQEAIGIEVQEVALEESSETLRAPGRIIPDETRFAYITPRAEGVVRSVSALTGQHVEAGDVLATIDSPEVGRVRLDLYTSLQQFRIAETKAEWQETIYRNTLELIARLEQDASPERIKTEFADRPVGQNREQLLTAYANERLAIAKMERNRELFGQGLITEKQFQEVRAEYEAAVATLQAQKEEMKFTVRFENLTAQQAKRQAETSVGVTRERLRILGVRPDGTEPEIKGGRVQGVRDDGTLPGSPDAPEAESPAGTFSEEKYEDLLDKLKEAHSATVRPPGAGPDPASDPESADRPVSTYALWSPFDGVVLDRTLIVPGVFIGTTERIFTIADLSEVWLEVNVHESDFGMLARSEDAEVRFTSPAYPDRTFEGRVIYTGDRVEEKSRTVLLLASSENPDGLLKPGMFINAEIRCRGGRRAAMVPLSALLSDGGRRVIYVRAGPERFERREVEAGTPDGDRVAILRGVEDGERVVVRGAFKLESKRGSSAETPPRAAQPEG